MTRQRTLHRHLLAMCTFLVPLGALAWLAHEELGRQAMQTRSAVDREALQFLGAAASALERSLDDELPLIVVK